MGAKFQGGPLAELVPAAVAWSMCAVSLALAALGLLLLALSWGRPGVPVFEQWVEEVVIAVGFSTVGAIVAPRFPSKNSIGWLVCSLGLLAGVLLFCGEYADYSLVARPGSLPGGEGWPGSSAGSRVLHIGLFAFLGLLFPDGGCPRPAGAPSPGWSSRRSCGYRRGRLLAGTDPGTRCHPQPLGIEGVPGSPSGRGGRVLPHVRGGGSCWCGCAGPRLERQQIKWFAYAASVPPSAPSSRG